jgi:hypothetical protein
MKQHHHSLQWQHLDSSPFLFLIEVHLSTLHTYISCELSNHNQYLRNLYRSTWRRFDAIGILRLRTPIWWRACEW